MEDPIETKKKAARDGLRVYLSGGYARPFARVFVVRSGGNSRSVKNTNDTAELSWVLYILSFFLEEATKKEREKSSVLMNAVGHTNMREIISMDNLENNMFNVAFLVMRALALEENLIPYMDLKDLQVELVY